MVDEPGRIFGETGNMIFDRLAIGTANWGKEYNGAKVSEDDQKRILDYCQCSGIDMIDTATAYGWDWTKVSSYFNIVVKVSNKDNLEKIQDMCKEHELYCLMAHNLSLYRTMKDNWEKYNCSGNLGHVFGLSVYEPKEVNDVWGSHVIQVPYSIYDRRFEKTFLTDETRMNPRKKVHEIHVRSIFLRGKLLKEFSPFECISFCLMNPYVDRVIIGADSYEQFKSNLRPFHNMNSAEKHDINLLDPRKWK
jgi:aryl-alcohol dehydrogenase-like predicted oxidoreductase